MMKILFISTLLFSQLGILIAQDYLEDGEDLAFCPAAQPYAFNDGERCCDIEVAPIDPNYDYGEQECEGDVIGGIACPTSLNCDNFFPVCNGYTNIEGAGFPDEDPMSKYNTAYAPLTDENNTAIQIRHRVVFGEKQQLSNSKATAKQQLNSRKCIYWEEEQGHWRLGQCIAIGKNFPCIGYTLKLKPNQGRCMVDAGGWVKACTNEIIDGAKLVGLVTFSSGASDVQSQTATASLSYVKTNSGSFKPKCKWRFRRGKFKCIRLKKKGKGKKKEKEKTEE